MKKSKNYIEKSQEDKNNLDEGIRNSDETIERLTK